MEIKMKIEEAISSVAIYPRKSRGDLESDLIKHKTLMIEVCKKYNWKYVIYEEIGSGDTIEKRPKMKQLLKDLDNDLYDAVLVVEYDRLGRGDEEDQGFIKKTFLKNKVLVVECSPYRILNLHDDADAQMVDFKGFLARQEYKMIVRRLVRGKKLGAKAGNWTNGIPPFPYEYDEKSKGLIINKEQEHIYQDMKRRLLNGESLAKIASHLNDIHYPSPRSKYYKQKESKWHGNTVNAILKSEVHLGKIISNKSRFDKYNKEKVDVNKDEWVIIENCHKACKTQEEHDLIIKTIISNRKNKRTEYSGNVNMFTSLIKCYNCETTLRIQKKPNGKLAVRKCQTCGNMGGECDFLDETISCTLKKCSKYLEKYKEDLLKINGIENLKDEIILTQDKVKKKEVALERIDDAYVSGDWTLQKMQEKSRPIRHEIEELTIVIESLKKEIEKNESINPVEIKEKYDEVLIKLKKDTSASRKNRIYKSIIKHIFWSRDGDNLEVYIELKQ